MTDDEAGRQSVEADHDLLTLGIAGARLHAEVDAIRSRIARMESSAGNVADSVEASRQAHERLRALGEGILRNTLRHIGEDNRREFFGLF